MATDYDHMIGNPEWHVERIHRHEVELTVRADPADRVRVAALLRELVPTLRNDPKGLLVRLKGGKVSLGLMSGIEAHALERSLRERGVEVTASGRGMTTYLFLSDTSVLVVEDDKEAADLAEKMIATGARVAEVEVD